VDAVVSGPEFLLWKLHNYFCTAPWSPTVATWREQEDLGLFSRRSLTQLLLERGQRQWKISAETEGHIAEWTVLETVATATQVTALVKITVILRVMDTRSMRWMR
jgi:hypothetical protein